LRIFEARKEALAVSASDPLHVVSLTVVDSELD